MRPHSPYNPQKNQSLNSSVVKINNGTMDIPATPNDKPSANLSFTKNHHNYDSAQNQNRLVNLISNEIDKEIGELPQAKLAMMSNYEKSEVYLRPPNVYRQTLNVDNLIAVCSKKLNEDPCHRKALFIRASSYLKKDLFQESINDCNKHMELDD